MKFVHTCPLTKKETKTYGSHQGIRLYLNTETMAQEVK